MTKIIALVAALGGVGAVAYKQLPEIRRYMKIKRM